MQRRQAWEILYGLSSFTRASFDAVKLLRSQRLVDDEVYAIIRLSFCLEEPLKTRVRNLLKRVAHHRQMTWPGNQQACLSLPFLSHQSFAGSVDRWLRGTVLRFRPILVPFHLPSTKVREAIQSCQDLLHNVPVWNKFLLQHGETDLPCKCSSLQLPTECFVDGHLAAGFELLSSIHPDLGYLGQGSANSTFFPSRTKFLADAKERFEKWRRIQELKTDAESLKAWVFQQIPKHIRSKYPRGVDSSGSLPVGFVLLKRRKMFRKGRTIVSYLHSPVRKLLAAAAYAIQLMLNTVWNLEWPRLESSGNLATHSSLLAGHALIC